MEIDKKEIIVLLAFIGCCVVFYLLIWTACLAVAPEVVCRTGHY